MKTPPTPPNIRLTISVTPEVHAAFQRLAAASSMSISRAMGDWLGDTLEAAEFMATKMEQARAAPRQVIQEMHAYALGLGDETGALLNRLRAEKKPAGGRAASAPAAGRPTPRPVIRGGKSRSGRTAERSRPQGKDHD